MPIYESVCHVCNQEHEYITSVANYLNTPLCCGVKTEKTISIGQFIISDEKNYKPYKSMVTGEMIEGKKNHREHLKRHNKIEIGNEKINAKPYTDHTKVDEGLKRKLYEVANSKL